MGNQLFKNLLLWLVIFITIIALYQFINTPRTNYELIPYSQFISILDSGDVAEVKFRGEKIKGTYTCLLYTSDAADEN